MAVQIPLKAMITEDMVERATLNPVPSRNHEWRAGQQQAYDVLSARGRTLYDNLRTQFDVPHSEAFTAAFERHGFKKHILMD